MPSKGVAEVLGVRWQTMRYEKVQTADAHQEDAGGGDATSRSGPTASFS